MSDAQREAFFATRYERLVLDQGCGSVEVTGHVGRWPGGYGARLGRR